MTPLKFTLTVSAVTAAVVLGGCAAWVAVDVLRNQWRRA